jgi:hypothetical protein
MSYVLLAATIDVQWIVWPVLAVIFGLGVLATFAPDRFAHIATRSSRWIETEEVLKYLDKPIDVDQHVLRYSRLLGIAVILASIWLGYLFWVTCVAR